MNVSKTMRYLSAVGTVALGTGVPMLAPSVALADGVTAKGGFTAEGMLGDAGKQAGFNVDTVNGETINGLVTRIATWAIGVAVALFVLRVVLTAVDRMVLGGQDPYGNQQSVLSGIPIVGAYPPKQNDGSGYTWKDVWLNFAKQLAICVGAWFGVSLIVGLVSWLMGTVTNG